MGIKYSDKIFIDLLIQYAQKSYRTNPIRIMFQNINSLIKSNNWNEEQLIDYIKTTANKWLKEYCNYDNLEHPYLLICKEYQKAWKLPFDETLLKQYFICKSNDKKFEFYSIYPSEKLLFTSSRAKEKNAWKQFIKDFWFLESNKDFRFQTYKDIYFAILDFEKLKENDLLHSEQKITTIKNEQNQSEQTNN